MYIKLQSARRTECFAHLFTNFDNKSVYIAIHFHPAAKTLLEVSIFTNLAS